MYLNDVAAWASDEVFVAGGQKKGRWTGVVLHWDGSEWARMETPQPRGAILTGVSAISADDVWAVGSHYTRHSGSRTLVLHFDGRKWSRIEAPSPGRYARLTSVRASSSANVWAIGSRGDGEHGLVLHYDGSRWRRVGLPDPIADGRATFSALEVTGRNDVWVVGNGGTPRHGSIPALALHFDGQTWRSGLLPDAAGVERLTDIEVTGPREVWAVGVAWRTVLLPLCQQTNEPLAGGGDRGREGGGRARGAGLRRKEDPLGGGGESWLGVGDRTRL